MKKRVPYRNKQSGSNSMCLVLTIYPSTSISRCLPYLLPKSIYGRCNYCFGNKKISQKYAISSSMLRGEGGRLEREEERRARITQLRKIKRVREGGRERGRVQAVSEHQE